MLLVMTTQGVFDNFPLGGKSVGGPRGGGSAAAAAAAADSAAPSSRAAGKLWAETWNRIDQFLPNFLAELFPNERPPSSASSSILGGRGSQDVGVVDPARPVVRDSNLGEGAKEEEEEESSLPVSVAVGVASKPLSSSPVMPERETLSGSPPGGSSGHTPRSSPRQGSPRKS